jgi:hypothetical protein
MGKIRTQHDSLDEGTIMKSLSAVLALAVVSTAAFAQIPAGHPKVDARGAAVPASKGIPDSALTQQGTVLSAVETKGFSYIEVKQETRTLWIAVPTTPVKAGDILRFEDNPVMATYESKSLKRTFSNVMFVSRVIVNPGK